MSEKGWWVGPLKTKGTIEVLTNERPPTTILFGKDAPRPRIGLVVRYEPPPREQWYEKQARKTWPGWSRAAAWNGWASRSLYPTYDLGTDKPSRPGVVVLRFVTVAAIYLLLAGAVSWRIYAEWGQP